VREIDDAHDAENQGEPDTQQRIGAAEHRGVQKMLE
jgi:hypothetical protein